MAVMALAPLIASGASAVAATATVATTIGSTAVTFGQIASAVSAVSGLVSGIQAFGSANAAAEAEQQASESRARELRLQSQQESTQQALLEAERQRKLRRTLATQRAAGAGVVEESGNILNIQQQTASQAQREGRLSELQSSLTIGQLNRQALSEQRAGQNALIAGKSKARTSLISTVSSFGSQVKDIKSTYKSPKTGEVITWN